MKRLAKKLGFYASVFVLVSPAVLVFLVQQYWVARKSTVTVTGKPAGARRQLTHPNDLAFGVGGILDVDRH